MKLRTRLLCALTMLGACSDSSGPDSPGLPVSPALVSSSIEPPVAASHAAVVGGQAYVSMVPGTDADGQRAEIRNLRNAAAVTAPMQTGGFDPVAVAAEAGDTLSVTVVHPAGDNTTTYSIVPIKARPRVVRTSPVKGKTDVPLNSVIRVVFSQPMDGASLTDALHLRRSNGGNVPGSVIGESTEGVILSARFEPVSPLGLLLTYELAVSTAAQSSDGLPLDGPLTVEFRTTAQAGLTRLRVAHAEYLTGDMDVFIDRELVVNDLSFRTATDYIELPAGRHEIWIQTANGRLNDFSPLMATGVDYTVIPCCALFPNGYFVSDDNSAPLAGWAKIRLVDFTSLISRIYLTSPGADLATAVPIPVDVNLGTTAYLEVRAGDYQIRLTPFDSDVVVLDSGTLTLSAGQVRTAIAVDAPGGGEPRDIFMLEDLN